MIQLFSSATVTAPAGLVCRGAGFGPMKFPVRFGLIQRSAGDFVLVDTGYGPRITTGRRSPALRLYDALLRPRLIPAGAPAAVLAARGASVAEVSTIILTHFHADHIARLDEFPHARLIAHGEAAAAMRAMTAFAAHRQGIFRELLPDDLMARLTPLDHFPLVAAPAGLGSGYDLFGDGTILAIPLPGHAFGHVGLLWFSADGPVLYATDAAWTMKALLEGRTPALARHLVFHDAEAGRRSEAMLRDFVRAGGRVELCHDPETH